MIQRIDHVNIVVADMEAMIAFYRDVLGFRLTRQSTIHGPWIDEVTGLDGVEADVAFLELSEGPSIELLHYRSPSGSRAGGSDRPNTQGFRHIALATPRLDELVAAISAMGIKLISAVQEVPATQVEYAQRKRLLYCRDPEGNLLELCAFE